MRLGFVVRGGRCVITLQIPCPGLAERPGREGFVVRGGKVLQHWSHDVSYWGTNSERLARAFPRWELTL